MRLKYLFGVMEEKGGGQRKKGRRRGRERKTETEKRRDKKDRKHVCTHQEREQKRKKDGDERSEVTVSGRGLPLKGTDQKE